MLLEQNNKMTEDSASGRNQTSIAIYLIYRIVLVMPTNNIQIDFNS